MFILKKSLCITLSLSLALPLPLYANTPHPSSSTSDVKSSDVDTHHQLALEFNAHEERLDNDQTVTPLALDLFSLLPQKTLEEKVQTGGFEWQENAEKTFEKVKSFHSWDKLTLKLVSEEGDERFRQDLSEFTKSNVGFSSGFKTCDAASCRIELSNEDPHEALNTKVVHQFFLETKHLAVVGPYIVFTTSNEDKNLKFIDLHSYENMIGNNSIPVFEIPLNIEGGIQSLVSKDNQLVVNGSLHLGINHLADLAPIYSAIFNISAHLVDSGSMASATPLYANISSFVEREFSSGKFNASQADDVHKTVIEQETFIENIKEKLELAKKQSSLGDLFNKAELSLEAYEKWMKESESFKKAIKQSQAQAVSGRRFFAKARQILGYISKPLPESSGKIKRAIKIVIGNTLYKSQDIYTRIGEVLNGNRSLSDLFSTSDVALTAGVIGAIALSQSVPGSYIAFAGDGLLYAKELLGYFAHVAGGYWDAHKTSFIEVGSLFSSVGGPIYDQYINPVTGQWYKFLIGSSVLVGTIGVILGGYHIPRRLYDLYKDMKSLGYKDLIHRQNRLEERFARLVSEGEADQAQRKADALRKTGAISEEDLKEGPLATKERLHKAQEDRGNKKGLFKTFKEKLGFKQKEVAKDLSEANEELQKLHELSEKDFQPIRTRWQAVKHLLFSTASYRATVGEYVPFFNTYASLRYSSFGWAYLKEIQKKFNAQIPIMIKIRPFGLAARLLYPEFFTVAVTKRSGKLTYPTALNGGMTSLLEKGEQFVSNLYKRSIYESGPEQLELFAQLQDSTPHQLKREIEKQKVFEDQIINTEELVISEALNAGIGEFTKFAKDDKDIRWLFSQTNGGHQITSKHLGLLDMRNKVFIRSYTDLVYHEAMKEILSEIVEPVEQAPQFETGSQAFTTKKELKALKASLLERSYNADDVQTKLDIPKEKVIEVVKRISQRPDILQKARSRASWAAMGLPSFPVISNHIKTEIAAALDGSQNPPMRNYEIVRDMQKDEAAMARATRNDIATLFRTLPIDIGMKFVATAGITMGIMKPIQDTFWGPNSVAYLSQYSFYGGLLAGIAFSTVSSSWGKLRQDYFDARDGLFGDIPQGEDAQKSYWSWFWKKWKSPENGLFKYWGNYLNIVFWNIPAAIPQIMLLNYLFMGRFDMDAFIIGYISIFVLPFAALFFKLDQVFEQSSYYAARGLKEKDLADPEVQMWLQKEMQRLRNKFNVVRDLSMGPLIEALANAEVTPTDKMGPRALLRYIFGGYTPTELVVLKMRDISEWSGSEIVKKVMEGCENFLTNGNPDLIKLKK